MASIRPLAAPAVPVEAAATAIFCRFDKDNDGRLNRAELSSFVQQVNRSMHFTDDQMEAILDELLIEYSAHADSEGMKLAGLVAAYRDGVGNVSADLSALGLRAEEVLSFVAAAPKKSSSLRRKSSLSPSPPPRPRQLAVRATASFKMHPSRSPSPVRRAAAALADVLALTSPDKVRGRKSDKDEEEGGGLPQSPAIAEAFRAAGFAAGRPLTESEEGEGAAADLLAASSSSVAAAEAPAAAAAAPAPVPAPPPKRRFWPPSVRAANSSPLRPPAMTRPAAGATAAAPAAASKEEEEYLAPLSSAHRSARPQQQLQGSSSASGAAAAAARAVRFDLSAYETPPPQTRKRHGDGEIEDEKNNDANDDEGYQNNSSDADDEACIASLMAQGEAAASAGRHAAAAAAYGSAAKLASGRCRSRHRSDSAAVDASSSPYASRRDPLTPAPRPRVSSRALFRLGNSLFAMGQPAASEAAYLEALRVMEEDIGDDESGEEENGNGDETSTRGKRASSSSDARLATSLRVNLGIAMEAQGMLAAAADQYAAAAAAADGLAEREREKRSLAVLGASVVGGGGQAPATTTTAAAAATAKATEKTPAAHHPAHSRAYKLLGSALFALGRPAAARDALQRALSIDPDYADAHCDLGCALCALGDAAGAAAAFSAALRVSSNGDDAAAAVAGESESKGKGENAGLHREALFNLANLRRQTGDFAAAVCGYDRVLELDPGHWRAHLGRAVALLGSRRDGDARGALRIAFALSGVSPSALNMELKMLKAAAAAPNPERATLAAAMAAVADRAAAEVAKETTNKLEK